MYSNSRYVTAIELVKNSLQVCSCSKLVLCCMEVAYVLSCCEHRLAFQWLCLLNLLYNMGKYNSTI